MYGGPLVSYFFISGSRLVSRDPKLQSRDPDCVSQNPDLISRNPDFVSWDPEIKKITRVALMGHRNCSHSSYCVA